MKVALWESRAAAELCPIVKRVHPARMAFLDPDVGPVGELRRHYTHEYSVVGKSGPSAVFHKAAINGWPRLQST
jgi:hypothetical protein